MCGIAGIVRAPGQTVAPGALSRMGQALTHRGPDDQGTWSAGNVGLAHQRLAIIDLSLEGHQPMRSDDGRYVLIYNGEIYNTQSLRQRLPQRPYRGHSDTEVLLRAIEQWGLDEAVRQLVGMFAFALFDQTERTLSLVRDRIGIKPLYYGWHENQWLFASELHAIEVATAERPPICADAVALMMRHNHIPAPYCIYQGFSKLPPASILQINVDQAGTPTSAPRCYWTPEPALVSEVSRTDDQWRQAMHEQLREAVGSRLVSDVSLGGFLSGGIDSTLIVALMQELSTKRVSTYSIGFHDSKLNEAEHAKATAAHLGCDHHELYLSHGDVLDAVAQLPRLCDEPFADQSILPTFLLCQMTRANVKVALSGDGGDEIMWGYERYPTRERLDRYRRYVPGALRPAVAAMLRSPILARAMAVAPLPAALGRSSRLADKLQMSATLLSIADDNAFYQHLMSHWKQPTTLVLGSEELSTLYSHPPDWVARLPNWKRMAVLDLLAYCPNDCLTKVDRASMAVGLEVRVPLLDHRVVELAYQLPEHLVRQGGTGKVLLRQILDQYVPREMMDRPKSGFGVPLADWLRGPLREWSQELLATESLVDSGLFNVEMVQSLQQQHQSGVADWSAYLWDVLMFQNWNQTRR